MGANESKNKNSNPTFSIPAISPRDVLPYLIKDTKFTYWDLKERKYYTRTITETITHPEKIPGWSRLAKSEKLSPAEIAAILCYIVHLPSDSKVSRVATYRHLIDWVTVHCTIDGINYSVDVYPQVCKLPMGEIINLRRESPNDIVG